MSNIRKWLGVGSALVGLMVVGCGGPVEEPTPGNEPQQSEAVADREVTASGCNDYGWWTCPDNGYWWLYYACLGPADEQSRSGARDVCNASCVATCVDSGWISG